MLSYIREIVHSEADLNAYIYVIQTIAELYAKLQEGAIAQADCGNSHNEAGMVAVDVDVMREHRPLFAADLRPILAWLLIATEARQSRGQTTP